jgi:hypothetical protein
MRPAATAARQQRRLEERLGEAGGGDGSLSPIFISLELVLAI